MSANDVNTDGNSKTPFELTETCTCDCCIYWRRRVHRIAADSDKRVGRVLSQLAGVKRQREQFKQECKRYVATLASMYKARRELQEPKGGLITRIIEFLC